MEVPEEAVLFDALRGDSPTQLFGSCLEGDSFTLAVEQLRDIGVQSRSRIAEIFGVPLASGGSGVEALDRITTDMWETGWSPAIGDVNLFATDFGVILAVALLELPGAVPVFRSQKTLNNLSVWFPKNGLEFFPFHKALMCLREKFGESLAQLYWSAVRTAEAGLTNG